jgi:C4-dicarboxylate transporter DctM subunit
MSFGICSVVYILARRNGFRADESTPPFTWGLFFRTFGKGFFSLATIVIVLGSIYAGLATPVEASVVAVIWALFVGGVVNRALRLTDLRDSLFEGAQLCGTLIIIMGAATLFGKIMTYEEAPLRLARAVLEFSTDKYVVLLLIIAALYVIGMFMETLVTVILVTPVLLPVIRQLGVDPIHFGIILIICNEVGLLTPPVGVNLFVASKLANVSVERLAIGVLPLIAVMTVVLLIIMFFPSIATWLPYRLGYGV